MDQNNSTVQNTAPSPAQPQQKSQTQAVPPAQGPKTTQKGSKVVLICVILFVILIIIFGGLGFYTFNAQKKQLKSLIDQQVLYVQSLDKVNRNIISLIQENVAYQKESEAMAAVGKDYLNIMVESSPLFASSAASSALGDAVYNYGNQLNKEKSLDQEGLKAVTNIQETNKKIDAAYDAVFLKFLLQNPKILTGKTSATSRKLQAILAYEVKINQLNIEMTTITQPATDTFMNLLAGHDPYGQIIELKSMISSVNKNTAEVEAIDISALPENMKKAHRKALTEGKDQTKLIEDIVIRYETRDKVPMKKDFLTLMSLPSTPDHVSFLTFWQSDESLKSISTMKQEWVDFSNKF